MSWKQTANSGYFGKSDNASTLQNSEPGNFGQGTSTTDPGYWGKGGTIPAKSGWFGHGGPNVTDPGYYGLGDR